MESPFRIFSKGAGATEVTVGAVESASAREASFAEGAMAVGTKRGVGALGHFGGIWLGVSAVGMAALSQWDHHVEKKRITNEYGAELATLTGKQPDKVKIGDMEAVAKENPAINEALRRSRTRRNLSIAATAVASVAAIGVATLIVPHIIVGVMATHLAAGAVGLAGHFFAATTAQSVVAATAGATIAGTGFLATEFGVEKYGEHKFDLHEPSLKSVERNPAKQAQLSVPSQITYLSNARAKGERITQEQVMTLFVSTNPDLARQIKDNYGKPFSKLDNDRKLQVLKELGPKYNVAEITGDINNGNIRVQELAFTAYGQRSGVERKGASNIGQKQQKAKELEAEVKTLAPATNAEIAQEKKEKLAFARSTVSAAVTEQQPQPLQGTAWRRRIDAQREQRPQQASFGVA